MRATAARRRLAALAFQGTVLTLSVKLLALAVIGGITFQLDFNGDLYLAGLRILHGITPYQPDTLAHQARIVSSGGTIVPQAFPRWPPPILLALTPLSLLPLHIADLLFMAICVASVLGALRLLDIRDGRCVLVVLVSCPTVSGVLLGNISPLIMLGAAAVWRYRDQPGKAPLITAATIAAKLFVWPLGFWMLITGRRRPLLLTAAAAAALIGGGWAVLGFTGILSYPRMLVDLAQIGQGRGSSLISMLMFLGLPVTPARVVAFGAGLLLLSLAYHLHRRGEGEHRVFGLVIVAALTLTPVIWAHYLLLLYIPIALLSPRLSVLWFLPALSLFAPAAAAHTYGWAILPTLLSELVLVGALCSPLFVSAQIRRYGRSRVATASASAPS